MYMRFMLYVYYMLYGAFIEMMKWVTFDLGNVTRARKTDGGELT